MLALILVLRVMPIPFALGVTSSERIVLGRVTGITTEYGIRVATVQVEKTLKGKPTSTLRFLAEKHWTCDVSRGVRGERGLFLLDSRDQLRGTMLKPWGFAAVTTQRNPPYSLNSCGSGRLIFERKGLAAYHFGDGELRYHHYILTPPFKLSGPDLERIYPKVITLPESEVIQTVEATLKEAAARKLVLKQKVSASQVPPKGHFHRGRWVHVCR